jgi:hypothetical protein
MNFCERPREDPENLETVRELCGSKDMGVIAVGGTDHLKVASIDTFQSPSSQRKQTRQRVLNSQFPPRKSPI